MLKSIQADMGLYVDPVIICFHRKTKRSLGLTLGQKTAKISLKPVDTGYFETEFTEV